MKSQFPAVFYVNDAIIIEKSLKKYVDYQYNVIKNK